MPSASSTPGQGSWASSRLPSRSTWSQRLARRRAGGDPEARLDHAAEHHAEPERTRRVGHAHGLADAARLGELDVDAVRARRARGDVGERVAVLVDVDGNRRATPSASGRPGRPPAAAARSTRRRAPRAAGSASSASSSDQYSFTSTCSGTSVTSRTARTRSTSRPSPPPSFSFSRRKPARVCLRGLRAMSSGSPSQIVHDVGGPARAQPEQPPDRLADELPAEVVQRRVDRRARGELARVSAAAASSPRARTGRRRGRPLRTRRSASADAARLVVTVDRRRLAEAGHPVVADLDLDDVGRRPATRARS